MELCSQRLINQPVLRRLDNRTLASSLSSSRFCPDPDVLFRENFDSLAQWEPLTFPKIKAHSTYTLVKEEGKSILKAESRDSASALVHRRTFNVYETPHPLALEGGATVGPGRPEGKSGG